MYSWTDSTDTELNNVRAFYKEVYRVIRQMYAERELTAQEAALDALGLPLIEFSCQSVCIQVRKPEDTTHFVCRKKEIEKRRQKFAKLDFTQATYAAHVTKYIHST